MKKIGLVLLLSLIMSFVIACGGDKGSSDPLLTYPTTKGLELGVLGIEYEDSVATATGAVDITYELHPGSGNKLLKGLELSEDGKLFGIPEEFGTGANFSHEFTVVASAEGFKPTPAKWSITIIDAAPVLWPTDGYDGCNGQPVIPIAGQQGSNVVRHKKKNRYGSAFTSRRTVLCRKCSGFG